MRGFCPVRSVRRIRPISHWDGIKGGIPKLANTFVKERIEVTFLGAIGGFRHMQDTSLFVSQIGLIRI